MSGVIYYVVSMMPLVSYVGVSVLYVGVDSGNVYYVWLSVLLCVVVDWSGGYESSEMSMCVMMLCV